MKVAHECDDKGPWVLAECWTKSMFIEAPGGGGEQFYHRLPNGNFEEASNGNRKIWLMHDIQEKHEPKLGTATCSICGVWAINDSLRKAWGYK